MVLDIHKLDDVGSALQAVKWVSPNNNVIIITLK